MIGQIPRLPSLVSDGVYRWSVDITLHLLLEVQLLTMLVTTKNADFVTVEPLL